MKFIVFSVWFLVLINTLSHVTTTTIMTKNSFITPKISLVVNPSTNASLWRLLIYYFPKVLPVSVI